jgi:plasmid stabilization system protein ParE
MRLELHRRIASDIAQIMEYYEAAAGHELAADFYSELHYFFETAVKFPLAFRERSNGLRGVDLKRFPFHFLFRTIPPDTVRILVIRHHGRRPLGRAEADSLSNPGSIKAMNFTAVNSRMILGARYNEITHEMDVVFRTGDKYRYKNVPRSVYDGLMSADSHGQYMHKKVLGRYDYERLE